MARKFDVVVIDEAAQAVEPAILVPLVQGVKQVSLDKPQQGKPPPPPPPACAPLSHTLSTQFASTPQLWRLPVCKHFAHTCIAAAQK